MTDDPRDRGAPDPAPPPPADGAEPTMALRPAAEERPGNGEEPAAVRAADGEPAPADVDEPTIAPRPAAEERSTARRPRNGEEQAALRAADGEPAPADVDEPTIAPRPAAEERSTSRRPRNGEEQGALRAADGEPAPADVDEPTMAQRPAADGPVTFRRLVTNEQTPDEGSASEPAAREAAADERAASEPVAYEPAAEEPVADEPLPARAEPKKPARRPAPSPNRSAQSRTPAATAEPGPAEETTRLSPVTRNASGEPSPDGPTSVPGDLREPARVAKSGTAETAAATGEPDDVGETVRLPQARSGNGTTAVPDEEPVRAGRKRRGPSGVIILVLLALLGFTLAVQLRGESLDSDLAAMREDDLVRLQSDLQNQEVRLQREIGSLEDSQRQLQSGAQGRSAALEEATRRADELAILSGTAAARGPGLTIRFVAGPNPIAASDILNAVQELRGADAEAMQIAGVDGPPVRVIASTYFVDADGGLLVSGKRLTGPYTITVIGDPPTMRTALNIPDGLVPSIKGDGGNVIVDEHDTVDVAARAEAVNLEYAKPVS